MKRKTLEKVIFAKPHEETREEIERGNRIHATLTKNLDRFEDVFGEITNPKTEVDGRAINDEKLNEIEEWAKECANNEYKLTNDDLIARLRDPNYRTPQQVEDEATDVDSVCSHEKEYDSESDGDASPEELNEMRKKIRRMRQEEKKVSPPKTTTTTVTGTVFNKNSGHDRKC